MEAYMDISYISVGDDSSDGSVLITVAPGGAEATCQILRPYSYGVEGRPLPGSVNSACGGVVQGDYICHCVALCEPVL